MKRKEKETKEAEINEAERKSRKLIISAGERKGWDYDENSVDDK